MEASVKYFCSEVGTVSIYIHILLCQLINKNAYDCVL